MPARDFDPTYRRGFNARDAYSFALACQLAYGGAKQVRATAASWGFGRVHVFDIRRGGGIDAKRVCPQLLRACRRLAIRACR